MNKIGIYGVDIRSSNNAAYRNSDGNDGSDEFHFSCFSM